MLLRPRPRTYASSSPLLLLQLHQQQQLLSIINIINSTNNHLQDAILRILLQHLTSHAAYERSGGPPKRRPAKAARREAPLHIHICYSVLHSETNNRCILHLGTSRVCRETDRNKWSTYQRVTVKVDKKKDETQRFEVFRLLVFSVEQNERGGEVVECKEIVIQGKGIVMTKTRVDDETTPAAENVAGVEGVKSTPTCVEYTQRGRADFASSLGFIAMNMAR